MWGGPACASEENPKPHGGGHPLWVGPQPLACLRMNLSSTIKHALDPGSLPCSEPWDLRPQGEHWAGRGPVGRAGLSGHCGGHRLPGSEEMEGRAGQGRVSTDSSQRLI